MFGCRDLGFPKVSGSRRFRIQGLGTLGTLSPGLAKSSVRAADWVAVKELKTCCHGKETRALTICPHYGNLNYVP